MRALSELRSNPEARRQLLATFDDLRTKLPPEVKRGSGGIDLEDPDALLEVIRECIAKCTNELAQNADLKFARAAVVALAVDGLMMRESLSITAFTDDQREQVIHELMLLADEAHALRSDEKTQQ